MITIFNRRELITLSSQQKLFAVRQALWDAGMDSQTRTHGMMGFGDRRRIEMPGANDDALYTLSLIHISEPTRH